MKWSREITLASSVAIFLIGCAVQGQPFAKFPSQPQEAVIYVYRPYNYAGSLLRPAVTCDDDTARIGPGGYHAFVVPAGHVTCNVATETADAVELDAEPRAFTSKRKSGGAS